MKFDRTQWIDAYRWSTAPVRWCRWKWMQHRGRVPVVVLYYHRVANDYENPWTISESDFERQIDWLSSRFDLVDLAECQRRIRSGFNDRPTASITFDDGYADNSAFALPLLIERQIPVTYFVTTHHPLTGEPFPHDLQKGVRLAPNSIESLQSMAAAGVEIGAHTRTHADIGSIDDPVRLQDELITATRDLEKLIDKPVRYFAFPYGMPGNLSVRAFQLLKQHGLAGVCTAYGGYNRIGTDGFHLQRMHGDPDLRRVKNWLTWDPRISDREQFDWRREWGGDDDSPEPTREESVALPDSLGQREPVSVC